MKHLIRQRLSEIRNTQQFINEYLALKNRQTEKNIFLSVYVNLEKARTSKLAYFKKMNREVEISLKAKLPKETANKILNNFNSINTSEISKYNLKSMAIFATENFYGFLPIHDQIQEGIYISKSLHLKPIIKWVYNWNNYYIITTSQKSIKVLKADDFELSEIFKEDNTHQEMKNELIRPKDQFFKLAFEKINKIIAKDNLPIILAGVKENTEKAKIFCKDPDISIYSMDGNFDYSSFDEIHIHSLKILNQINFDRDIFIKSELRSSKSKIETNLDKIIKMATLGKIQKLLIARDKTLWGEINKNDGTYELFMHQNLAIPEDDILDDLAEIVLSKGGKISVMEQREIPYGVEAIAMLR